MLSDEAILRTYFVESLLFPSPLIIFKHFYLQLRTALFQYRCTITEQANVPSASLTL
jgi:hypothetical protein